MKGIPPSLHQALRNEIINCCPLEETLLRAWFKDDRLALWESHLPGFEGLNRLARAEALIDFLVNRANRSEENGLVLFLRVLRDETDVGEACHERLDWLANQVVTNLQEQAVTEELPEEKSLLLAEVKVTLWRERNGWFLQVQNVSQRSLKKVTIFLHSGQALWINKYRLSFGILLPTAVSTPVPLTISIKQPKCGKVREAYQLIIEAVYLPQSGGQPTRLQKSLEILV